MQVHATNVSLYNLNIANTYGKVRFRAPDRAQHSIDLFAYPLVRLARAFTFCVRDCPATWRPCH